jgi:signal transduction histidine kinase
VTIGFSGIPEIDTAAEALNRAATRIGDLVERERSVTDHASHQLRTPLAGLRLSLENALHTPGADYRAAAQEAVAAADPLERTIDDLLALARSRDGRAAEQPGIAVLVNELDGAWRGSLAEGNRSLILVIDPHLEPPQCSTAAVRQILAVLVDNAVRHGRGTVTIRARETIGTVAVDVCDEGDEGDGPTDDDGVFDRPRPDGHGIGLRLARSLADAEGGRLLLSSRDPTTFTFFMLGGAADR